MYCSFPLPFLACHDWKFPVLINYSFLLRCNKTTLMKFGTSQDMKPTSNCDFKPWFVPSLLAIVSQFRCLIGSNGYVIIPRNSQLWQKEGSCSAKTRCISTKACSYLGFVSQNMYSKQAITSLIKLAAIPKIVELMKSAVVIAGIAAKIIHNCTIHMSWYSNATLGCTWWQCARKIYYINWTNGLQHTSFYVC